MEQPRALQLVTGATEVLISNVGCRLVTIVPQGTTLGTVTVREAPAIGSGNAPRFTCAIGLTQQMGGSMFSENGVMMGQGLTIQLSNGADTVGIITAPLN